MRIAAHTRRGFLGTIGAALAARAGIATGAGDPAPALVPQASSGEYGLAPGLTYLNTGSLGPTSRDVLEATLEAWRQIESNPVQMAYGNGAVHVATDRVREAAARFIGCAPDELLLTRCTTEGMNSVALGMRLDAGARVLTTDQEHHGGNDCWQYLARRRGVVVDTVPLALSDHDPQRIVDRFAAAITPATRVISVSHICTSTGLRMPVAELARLARSRGLLCVVDGAQTVGQIAVNVKELGCHAYAASGHKWLLGPKGTGFLYVSADAADAVAPVQWQDTKRYVAGSAGMGSLPLVVGLGRAIEHANARGMASIERRTSELREHLVAQLRRLSKVTVVSAASGLTASALVAVQLPSDVDARAVQLAMRDKHRVMVKLVEVRWFNGLRISPHIFNTEADIDRAIGALRAELR
jgi:selenocysteine lyase/cysteine desulfurase